MAGLTNAMVTGQNFADKDAPVIEPATDTTDVVAKFNALLEELKKNGLIKAE